MKPILERSHFFDSHSIRQSTCRVMCPEHLQMFFANGRSSDSPSRQIQHFLSPSCDPASPEPPASISTLITFLSWYDLTWFE